jgi:hypothetical protein
MLPQLLQNQHFHQLEHTHTPAQSPTSVPTLSTSSFRATGQAATAPLLLQSAPTMIVDHLLPRGAMNEWVPNRLSQPSSHPQDHSHRILRCRLILTAIAIRPTLRPDTCLPTPKPKLCAALPCNMYPCLFPALATTPTMYTGTLATSIMVLIRLCCIMPYTTDYIRLAYPHLYSIDEQGYILHPEPNHIRIGV